MARAGSLAATSLSRSHPHLYKQHTNIFSSTPRTGSGEIRSIRVHRSIQKIQQLAHAAPSGSCCPHLCVQLRKLQKHTPDVLHENSKTISRGMQRRAGYILQLDYNLDGQEVPGNFDFLPRLRRSSMIMDRLHHNSTTDPTQRRHPPTSKSMCSLLQSAQGPFSTAVLGFHAQVCAQ